MHHQEWAPRTQKSLYLKGYSWKLQKISIAGYMPKLLRLQPQPLSRIILPVLPSRPMWVNLWEIPSLPPGPLPSSPFFWRHPASWLSLAFREDCLPSSTVCTLYRGANYYTCYFYRQKPSSTVPWLEFFAQGLLFPHSGIWGFSKCENRGTWKNEHSLVFHSVSNLIGYIEIKCSTKEESFLNVQG